MITLSLSTFRERWQLFIGAILSVAVGVALVQSSLQVMASAGDPPIPAGLAPLAESELRGRYGDATTLMGMTMMLSVFLAIFIVSSTFAFTVAQRRRDLALLRLVGAGRGSVRTLLLSEALLLGMFGVLIGIPLGMPAVSVQTWLLAELDFLPAGFESQFNGWMAGVSAVAGLGVALLGVLAASRRASRVRPLEALRDTGDAAKVMTRSRWAMGLLCLGCSVAMVFLAQQVGLVIALALSLGLTVTGAVALSLLSPIVVPLTARVFGFVLRGSTLGLLAERNLRDDARRSASTAAPLIVLVALLLGLSGTLGSMALAAGEEQRLIVDGDLVVEGTGDQADAVADVAGVEVASPQFVVPMTLRMMVVNADTGEPREKSYDSGIVAIDSAAYLATHRIDPQAGSLAELQGATLAAAQRSEDRLEVGGTATATLGDTESTLTLSAVLPERLSSSEAFLVPRDQIPAEVLASAQAHTVVQVADGAHPADVAEEIRAAELGAVSTVDDWAAAQTTGQQDTNVGTMVVLMGLSGLYALMAVINAVVIACTERKREFASTRVTGLTRAQVVRMALAESLAVAVIGLFLGGLVVAGTLAGIAAGTLETIGMVVVEIPWALFGMVAAGSFLVIGVTSVLATLSATRIQPVSLVAARE
ncbi:FtsX-like permease family protein [Actinoalloteichus hymeniacidonis]|uniref:FtsX-like permease family n=1 Tax=Actinoalloteichus hymeniacidonis TaxID=340345 RepID=A0AAC9HRG0_9PSEU|nr:ABC transporter permease [Actinoalloteichus hymeniacidonis]AOS64068.1 FtsX-like permease family [Actinoalloteichus hymeniacidonis]MBB5907870.1 putative ABC transport system permease protein [Actinoalloteichus hymeniacidonis]